MVSVKIIVFGRRSERAESRVRLSQDQKRDAGAIPAGPVAADRCLHPLRSRGPAPEKMRLSLPADTALNLRYVSWCLRLLAAPRTHHA